MRNTRFLIWCISLSTQFANEERRSQVASNSSQWAPTPAREPSAACVPGGAAPLVPLGTCGPGAVHALPPALILHS